MPGGRPRKDSDYIRRIRVTYRFSPEVVKAIEKVVTLQNETRPRGDTLHRTDYVESAVRQRLQADGVLLLQQKHQNSRSAPPLWHQDKIK
jgi:hypothetical protein